LEVGFGPGVVIQRLSKRASAGHVAGIDPCNMTSCVVMTLFATGIALSLLLIAAYSRPFTGGISVGPDLLKQVIASEAMVGTSR
jgi:hypothetical protein